MDEKWGPLPNKEKAMPQDTEANKSNAIAFYRTAYLGDPAAAVERYVQATSTSSTIRT